MASKPESQHSTAYARRMARKKAEAEARGEVFNKQAARGHKAKEHVIRREKERRKADTLGTLTSADRAYARKLGPQLAERSEEPPTPAEARIEAVKAMTRIGAEVFRAEVKKWRELVRDYRNRHKTGWDGLPGGMATLEFWSENGGFPNPKWYYYH